MTATNSTSSRTSHKSTSTEPSRSSERKGPRSAFEDPETPIPFPDGLWAWGIDLSTKRIAIASLRGRRWRRKIVEIPAAPSGAGLAFRLARTQDALEWTLPRIIKTCPPGIVCVEEPIGVGAKTALTATLGVLLATVERVHVAETHHPVNLILASPPKWKKAVIGMGNADKHLCMLYARTWYDHKLDDQDLADALCIATYAQGVEIVW